MNGNPALSGNLKFISLADLFQLLGGNGSTGVLKITSRYAPNPGQVYFVKGNPINAACDRLKGINALYPLFGWLDGEFEFYEKDVNMRQIINQGRMEIVLDALRMLDDGNIKKLGPPEEMLSNEGIKKGTLPVITGPVPDYSYITTEEDFDDGRAIVREGKFGKWIWVVLEGKADVMRETENGPMTISRLGEGSFVGTFTALLFGEYTRKGSVVARGKTVLGLLDTERLSREFNSLSQEFRALLVSLDKRLIKITDRAVALYAKRESLTLPRGLKVIMKKGTSKRDAYTITQGTAYMVDTSRKDNFPLITLEEGDVFGNFSFLEMGHEPRSASVLATKDLKTKDLEPESLKIEYDQLSNIFRNFIHNICTCISLTTREACYLHDQK